jgi:hypothetical protein
VDWDTETTEPLVTFEGRIYPISDAFEAMRGCTDIMPHNLLGDITERLTKPWEGEGPLDTMTFSTAARVMGVLVRKRLLANNSQTPVAEVVRRPEELGDR